MEDNTKQLLRDADSFRKLAFFGIAVSTVATLTAIVAVPMLYNYMVSPSPHCPYKEERSSLLAKARPRLGTVLARNSRLFLDLFCIITYGLSKFYIMIKLKLIFSYLYFSEYF